MHTSHTGPSVLGILFTSTCNFECRHCCNDSGPNQRKTLEFDHVAQLIDDAQAISSICEIGFSGGEPFLKLPLLKAASKYAASKGFSVSVTTNGYWSKLPRASSILSDLKDCGLKAINISTSEFHLEFAQFEVVEAAARMAVDEGLKVTINVVESEGMALSAIKAKIGSLSDDISFVAMPCLPTGRAETEVTAQEARPDISAPIGNCAHHFTKLAVDINGDVFPCCSPGGFSDPLKLGNAHREQVHQIFQKSMSNGLLAILEDVGPGFFLPFVQAAGADRDLPAKFRDQCHLCNSLMRSSDARSEVLKVTEQLLDQLAAEPVDGSERRSARMRAILRHRAASVSGGAHVDA